MRESVIDQEWRAEALREGLEEGGKEGIQQGGATLVWRLLQRKLSDLPPALEVKIRALPAQ